MLNVKELKSRAWEKLRKNYWYAFLVCFLIGVIISGPQLTMNIGSSSLSGFTNIIDMLNSEVNGNYEYEYEYDDYNFDEYDDYDFDDYDFGYDDEYDDFNSFEDELNLDDDDILAVIFSVLGVVTVVLIVYIIFLVIGLLYQIFVVEPFRVGKASFFKEMAEDRMNLNNLMYSFKKRRYKNVVKTVFIKRLYLFLWGLLSVIPVIFFVVFTIYIIFKANTSGNDLVILWIINALVTFLLLLLSLIPFYYKTISYMFVEYILSDNDSFGSKNAMQLSIAMTKGHKLNILKLVLSFVGWYVLGFIACCIGVMFVNPYFYATMGELYKEIRAISIENGLITKEELNIKDLEPVNGIDLDKNY